MSISSIGLSGMRAAQMQLDATAHNLANAQTPSLKRQAVTQAAQPNLGGTAAEPAQQPSSSILDAARVGHLTEDMVTQKMAVYTFAANLRSVETEDRLLGTLLDKQA